MDKPKDAAPVVAVIGAGEMGAAVGQRLHKSGARVLTSLKGRGPQSVERVRQAGLEIVDDDDELERVSDIGLLANKTVVLGPGRPIEVGWMKGRSQSYAVAGSTEGQVLSIAFNDQCDVIVALVTLERTNQDPIEPAVIAFLNSDRVLRWAKWLMS